MRRELNEHPKSKSEFVSISQIAIQSNFKGGKQRCTGNPCGYFLEEGSKEMAGSLKKHDDAAPLHRTLSGRLLDHIKSLSDNEHQVGPCHKSNVYEDSWKLFYTSLLFMVPAIMAFFFNLLFLSGTSFTVSVAAMNYWRNAKFGWRRWIDMTVAKAAFLIYLYHAVMHARSLMFGVITAIITSTMYYLYTNVSVLISKQSKEWVKYHAAFHGMVILAQVLVILEMA